MEFDSNLTNLQGTLLSLERKLKGLKTIKYDSDDTKIVVEAIKTVINEAPQDETCKRKMHLYLILNTDFPIRDELFEDSEIAHLIDTAPTLSQDLLVSIVEACDLHKFACEVIIFMVPPLSVQYLDALVTYFPLYDASEIIIKSAGFADAVFLRICRLYGGFEVCNNINLKPITKKLFEIFKNLILSIPQKISKKIPEAIVTEISGQVTKYMIGLVSNCLEHIEKPDLISNCYPQPQTNINFDYSQWGTEEIEVMKVLDFVANECLKNMQTLTQEWWAEWEDIPGECEDRSLQDEVALEAYICVRKKNSETTETLFKLKGVLMDFERKPHDEYDDIAEADLTVMIASIGDSTKEQKYWIEGLLQRVDGLSRIEALSAIEAKIDILTISSVAILLDRAIAGNSANDDLLKTIAYKAFQKAPTHEQLNLLEDFFTNNKLNDFFKRDTFSNDLTAVLNKASNQPKSDKWLPELLALCLQSPQEVMEQIILAGVASRGQAKIMSSTLIELVTLCQFPMEVDTKKPKSLLLHALDHTIATVDLATTQITHLVMLLEEKKLLNKVDFLEICLMPALSKNVVDHKVAHIQLWLQILRKMLKIDTPVHEPIEDGVHVAALLAFLAEILQRSSWVLGKFRQQESLLRADTVLIIRPLACRFANACLPNDKELLWLRNGLLRLTSQNRSHFSPLWTHFGLPVPSMNLGSLLLSRDALNQLSHLPGGPDQLLSPLLILLPSCCTPEWRLLTSSLATVLLSISCSNDDDPEDSSLGSSQTEEQILPEVLRLLITTLMLQSLMMNQQKSEDPVLSNDCAMACLENSVRNLGIILKEEWLPRLVGVEVVQEGASIVRQVALLLHSLPLAVAGSCSLALSGLLIQAQEVLLLQAAPQSELATWCSHELALSLALLPDRDSRQALARKFLTDPSLARLK